MSKVRILLCTIGRFGHAEESRDLALTKVMVGGWLAQQISASKNHGLRNKISNESQQMDCLMSRLKSSSPTAQSCLRSSVASLMYSRSYIKSGKERLTQKPAIK